MPAFSLFLGLLLLAAFWIGGRPLEGLWGLLLMAGIGALFLFSKSETLRGLGGPGRDERWVKIDAGATLFAGFVLLTAVLGLWLYEIARGEDGRPYGLLAALAGVAYIAGVVWGRLRS